MRSYLFHLLFKGSAIKECGGKRKKNGGVTALVRLVELEVGDPSADNGCGDDSRATR
jgi:hypothetical protein